MFRSLSAESFSRDRLRTAEKAGHGSGEIDAPETLRHNICLHFHVALMSDKCIGRNILVRRLRQAVS